MVINPYKEKTADQPILDAISPFSAGASQFQSLGGGQMIQMLMQMMGLNSSMTPGASFLNKMDNTHQSASRSAVEMSAMMATNSMTGNNRLSSTLRGIAGSYIHDQQGFTNQYSQAITRAGVMAPMYTGDMLKPMTRASIETMPGIPLDASGRPSLDMLQQRSRMRGENITDFFRKTADAYGEDQTSFGGANLGDAGKIAGEMVRTGGSMFDGDKYKSKTNELQKNIKEFTAAAEDIKGVLGGDALHALDVMNDAFGVNVTATFRDNSSLLKKQTSDIVQTARLTGTSAANIMRMGGIAGQQMQKYGGDHMGAMMVGTMAAQAGQAGDLAFIDEGTFRSMQTTRLAGAASSDTAKRISGAYATWRANDGKSVETEEAARLAFNKALDSESPDFASRGDVDVLRRVSGASSNQALMMAGNLRSARLFRATDTTALDVVKSRQIRSVKTGRLAIIRSMLKRRGFDVNVDEYEAASQDEQTAMLGGNTDASGSIVDAVDIFTKGQGYISEDYYRAAVQGDKKAREIRIQAIARRGYMDALEIKETTGMRGVLDAYDNYAKGKYKDNEEQTMSFKKLVATSMGLKDTDSIISDMGFDPKALSGIPGSFEARRADREAQGLAPLKRREDLKNLTSRGVKTKMVAMLETLNSGVLADEDKKKLQTDMRTIFAGGAGSVEAFERATSIGTSSGYSTSLLKKYGASLTAEGMTRSTKVRRAGLLGILKEMETDGKVDATRSAELRKEILTKGVASQEVQNSILKDDKYGNKFSGMMSRSDTSIAADPMSMIAELVSNIYTEMTKTDKPKQGAGSSPTSQTEGG